MANALTSLRLLLVLPVAVGLARPGSSAPYWLLACIVVAIATDYFDGIVARRTGTASPRGQLFDHSTDFLFVTSGLGGAAIAGTVPAALPLLIVVAFSQYVLDSYWLHRDKQLRMSTLGRWNGILYFVAVVVVALSGFDFATRSGAAWPTLVAWLSYALLASTGASILDRAMAPLRAGARAPSK